MRRYTCAVNQYTRIKLLLIYVKSDNLLLYDTTNISSIYVCWWVRVQGYSTWLRHFLIRIAVGYPFRAVTRELSLEVLDQQNTVHLNLGLTATLFIGSTTIFSTLQCIPNLNLYVIQLTIVQKTLCSLERVHLTISDLRWV